MRFNSFDKYDIKEGDTVLIRAKVDKQSHRKGCFVVKIEEPPRLEEGWTRVRVPVESIDRVVARTLKEDEICE